MKTWKKIVIGIIILAVIGITACIATKLSSNPKFIIPTTTVEYQTKEELTDIYWQNKTVLNAVKDSVISSKSLLRALDEYKEGDIDVRSKLDKEYFSD